MESFAGKSCIVTGAAHGIGRACAIELGLRCKSNVVLADIDKENLQETVDYINQNGGHAIAFVGDTTDEASVKALVVQAVHSYGRLDYLSSNVAMTSAEFTGKDGMLDQYDLDYLMTAFRVNTAGTWLLIKYSIPEMLKTGGGAIVCMSSTAANFGGPTHTVYGMTKAALEKLVRGTAAMYGRQGIRINAVEPSTTMTPALIATYPENVRKAMLMGIFNPAFTDGDKIASVVSFLLSDDAYTIQGATIPADNGFNIASGMYGATTMFAEMSQK